LRLHAETHPKLSVLSGTLARMDRPRDTRTLITATFTYLPFYGHAPEAVLFDDQETAAKILAGTGDRLLVEAGPLDRSGA
jgi:hypothetical protein